MSSKESKQLVLKDSGKVIRMSGLFFIAASSIFILAKTPEAIWSFLVSGVGLLLISSDLTITADRSTRTLQIDDRYLLFRNTKKLDFDDIADIQVQHSKSAFFGGYRVVAIMQNEKKVPFRWYYAAQEGKEEQAEQLRAFINKADRHKSPASRRKSNGQPEAGSAPMLEPAEDSDIPPVSPSEPETKSSQ